MKPLLLLLSLLLAACSVPPRPVVEGIRPSTVVIVHGLFANANHVRPLKTSLEAQGFTCLSPNLKPNDGSVSIETLSQQLEDYISSKLPHDTPLQIIGHSMGGLVALQYLQDPKNASRCRSLYTIATPHKGTLLATFHGGPAGRQMTSNSSYLKNLHANRPPFPVVTYRSTNDIVIIPNSSSILPFADNQLIESSSHNEILQSPQLSNDLTERIRIRDRVATL